MFEQEFDNMFAEIWFDDAAKSDASQEGIGEFDKGWNTLHSLDALIAVRQYDVSLGGTFPACKRKRLLAQRNSLVSAFGPEMEQRVGFAK